MKKIWHPYWTWEEWKAGMWRKLSASEERNMLPLAVEFTGNPDLYGSFMVRVTNEWPVSCEHNLTDRSLNKQAWIGHAACALAHSLPEYLVRSAWGRLTDDQRNKANLKASEAVYLWTKQYQGKQYGWQKAFEF